MVETVSLCCRGARTLRRDTDWTLLLRGENDIPRTFCSIRRIGTNVFVSHGGVKTGGLGETHSSDTEDAARQHLAQLVEDRLAEGFSVVRSGGCDPKTFDYGALCDDVVEGARRAFEAVRAAHADERIDAYALYSDSGAMTIVCAADSTEARGGVGHERRWYCQEWPYIDEGGEHLEVAYRRILTLHGGPHEPPEGFEGRVFEACMRALERLDREGFFGTGAARARTLVTFESRPGDDPAPVIRRLNPKELYDRLFAED